MKLNERPNVLIAMDTMMCGGIEKSLISLLCVLSENELKCNVLFNNKKGAFLKYIPKWVNIKSIKYDENIVKEKCLGRTGMLKYWIRRFDIINCIKFLRIYRRESRLGYDEEIIHRSRRFQKGIVNSEDFLTKTYDLAVAYANFEQMILVAENVKAHRKIAFFHSDFKDVANNIHAYDYVLSYFDSIYCVSKDLTSALKSEFPNLSDCIHFYPHVFSRKNCEQMATKEIAAWPDNKDIKLLTVARFEKDKGVDMIPEIAKELRSNGMVFNWIIIGGGSLIKEIRGKIHDYDLENYVVCQGASDNPYPYFKTCDIYIQPSRNEGYCLTLAEARAFNRPIISTKFYGSVEQLDNGRLGMLTNPDVKSLSAAIYELSHNEGQRQKYSESLSKETVDSLDGVGIFMQEVKKSML